MDLLQPFLIACAAAITPIGILVAAAVKARAATSLGTEEATAKYIATIVGENAALSVENARLRTDLAGCESDNRRLMRLFRDTPSE